MGKTCCTAASSTTNTILPAEGVNENSMVRKHNSYLICGMTQYNGTYHRKDCPCISNAQMQIQSLRSKKANETAGVA
jgi:hypothetical protein